MRMLLPFLTSFWGQLMLFFGSWAALNGGIWKLFEKVDKVVSPAARKQTVQWLRQVDIEQPIGKLGHSFEHAFDAVFGSRHLSWKCFLRSALASYLWSAVLFLFWAALHPTDAYESTAGEAAYLLLIVSAFLNVFPDYLSLLKTRYLIGFMYRLHSRAQWILFVLLDAALSALIAFVTICFIMPGLTAPSALLSQGLLVQIKEGVALLPDILRLRSLNIFLVGKLPSLGIWYYSNFLTSVWMWLYLGSAVLVSLATTVGSGWNLLRKWLNVKEEPFRSLAMVCIIITTVAYLLFIPIIMLIRS